MAAENCKNVILLAADVNVYSVYFKLDINLCLWKIMDTEIFVWKLEATEPRHLNIY
jgi:hypothetical protein